MEFGKIMQTAVIFQFTGVLIHGGVRPARGRARKSGKNVRACRRRLKTFGGGRRLFLLFVRDFTAYGPAGPYGYLFVPSHKGVVA